jgi:cytochrome b
MTAPAAAKQPFRLWDGPTRLVHWAIVVLIGIAWWTAKTDHMDWHRLAGYGALALILFRIVWGFVGAESARFGAFLKGPAATLRYARGLFAQPGAQWAGHNPLGGWSVAALLGVLVVQLVTGLFAVDVDGLESGPLSDRVDFNTGRIFAAWHHGAFTVLQALVVLHLAAIAFYAAHKRVNLVWPMITGRGAFAEDPKLRFVSRGRAAIAAVFAVLVAAWIAKGLRL